MPPKWIPSFESTLDNLGALENRSAEKRVAEALNKISSPDVCIFHSLRYSVPRNNAATLNLEIDFLVVWKNRGFLILEVKGGRIDFDAFEGNWCCTPRNQPRKVYSRSPVKQVEGQKNDFCSSILPDAGFSKGLNARNVVERVLVFPDVPLSAFKDQHGQRPKRIDDFEIESIVDSELLQSLPQFVERKLDPCANYITQHKIPGKIFDDTVNYLRSSVRAEVPLQHIFENAESSIEAVTNAQKESLRPVISNSWLLMVGPAGTAKTVLGLSAMLTWMASGANAYYITANKYLVAGLRKDPRYAKVKDRIQSVHDFLQILFGQTIEDSNEAMTDALTGWEWSTNGLSVVLDEAQDLEPDLYEAFVSFLPCERLWVLRDNRQAGRVNDNRKYDFGPLCFATKYELNTNCRNTRSIASHIKNNVDLPAMYVNDFMAQGEPVPPSIEALSSEDQNQKLCELLKRSKSEGCSSEKIVVISCLAGGRDAVRTKYCSSQSSKVFGGMFSYGGEDDSKVAIYHIMDFRGLESLYVIVTDIEAQESIYRIIYLAGSRAKVKLQFIRMKKEEIVSEIPEDMDF